MKKTIQVTAVNIKYGKRHTNSSCPVARAVKKAFNVRKYVTVNSDNIFVGDKHWATPDVVREFIARFDGREPGIRSCAPFSFTIDL